MYFLIERIKSTIGEISVLLFLLIFGIAFTHFLSVFAFEIKQRAQALTIFVLWSAVMALMLMCGCDIYIYMCVCRNWSGAGVSQWHSALGCSCWHSSDGCGGGSHWHWRTLLPCGHEVSSGQCHQYSCCYDDSGKRVSSVRALWSVEVTRCFLRFFLFISSMCVKGSHVFVRHKIHNMNKQRSYFIGF